MSEDNERNPQGSFKATAVCFTYNNPTLSPGEVWDIFRAQGAGYCVFQREKGSETGTEHYQGYVHFGGQRTVGVRLRSKFPTPIWLTRARGNPAANRAYCTKEDTREEGPWEHGTLPGGQGSRSDLTAFYDAVRHSGKRSLELMDEHHCIFARYPKFYTTILSLQMPALRTDRTVNVILSFGKTGVGKTRTVMEKYAGDPTFYRAPIGGGFWMDGYDGHKVVLIDDFLGAASKISLVHLLQLLDNYPVQVPVKGSFTWWYPELIIMTTNQHPWEWYDFTRRLESYNALMRRFTTIMHDLLILTGPRVVEFAEWRPEPSQYPNLPYNSGPSGRSR